MKYSVDLQEIVLKCKENSDVGIDLMRRHAIDLFGDQTDFIIGVNGSYARREVTSGSDVDLFFLTDGDAEFVKSKQLEFNKLLTSKGLKLPATGGVFEKPLSVARIREKIGGMEDTNISITRRMLMMLEGEWIFNKSGFDSARASLIECYVSDDHRKQQICMFLLNDIIRYWRTICVDFEYKVNQGGKPKAIRLIKLRFSRMMLYLAGVLAIGETYDKSSEEKRETLAKLLAMPVIERFQYIIGKDGDAVLAYYAEFLNALDTVETRERLELPDPEGENTEEYKHLRGLAQDFRNQINLLLKNHYNNDNPILTALML